MRPYYYVRSVEDGFRVFQASQNPVQLGWFAPGDPTQIIILNSLSNGYYNLASKSDPHRLIGTSNGAPGESLIIGGKYTTFEIVEDKGNVKLRSVDNPNLYVTSPRNDAYTHLILWEENSQVGMQTWQLTGEGHEPHIPFQVRYLVANNNTILGWEDGRFTIGTDDKSPFYRFRLFDWVGGRAFQNVGTGKYLAFVGKDAQVVQYDRVCNEALWSVDVIYSGSPWHLIRPALNQDLCLDIPGDDTTAPIHGSLITTTTWMNRNRQCWALGKTPYI